jgi:hypothetical protein
LSYQCGPCADDWKWYSKEVVKKLQELHAEGYQLAFFSNQGGIKGALNGKASDNVRGKVDGMLEALEKKAPGVQAQVWGARGAGCGGARGEPKSTTCHTFWRETRCVGGAGGARVGGKQPCS